MSSHELFFGDQVRDAKVVLDIPTNTPFLGPISSAGNYFLPPVYFYLMYVFSLGFKSVNWLYSFSFVCGIALLPIWYVFFDEMLPQSKHKKTLLLSAFLYITINTNEINDGSTIWNPNTLNFWFLSSLLLANNIHKSPKNWSVLLLGLCLSIFSQLHTGVLPVVALLFLITVKGLYVQKQWIKICLLCASFSFLYTPYLLYEITHGFGNTVGLVKSFAGHGIKNALLGRLYQLAQSSNLIFSQVYTKFDIGIVLAIFPLVFYLYLGYKLYHKNFILKLSVASWAIFLFFIVGFHGKLEIFHLKILWFAPIVLAIAFLSTDTNQKWIKYVCSVFIIITLSANIYSNIDFFTNKFSQNRVANYADIVDITNRLPDNSHYCETESQTMSQKKSVQFIVEFEHQKNLVLVDTCNQSNYTIISKYRTKFGIGTDKNTPPNNIKIIAENQGVYLGAML